MIRMRTLVLATIVCCGAFQAVSAASGARPEDWGPRVDRQRISAGGAHSCAVVGDDTIYCWGNNAQARLGLGSSGGTFPTPQHLASSHRAVVIAAGPVHSCLATPRGKAKCWGSNLDNQLGPRDDLGSTAPQEVIGLEGVRSVAVGEGHSCALVAGGNVKCWGAGGFGQLGSGGFQGRAIPEDVSGLTDAIALTAGRVHVCALRAAGTVVCWGNNQDGQLGSGSLEEAAAVPVAVSGLSDAIALTAGDQHTCALRRAGSVVCWGGNASGQLGRGSLTPSRTPVSVSNLGSVTSISAGQSHTCARRVDGTARCWGSNSAGQLGDGNSGTVRTSPVTVLGLSRVVSIAAGGAHSCAMLANDTFRCWGEGASGQLGNNLRVSQTLSAAVVGLAGSVSARMVATGALHTCAVRSDGSVACWGGSFEGQAGVFAGALPVPVAVAGLSDAIGVVTGQSHSCALLVNGRVSCWGSNASGQLGAGTIGVGSGTPLATPITDAVALVAGRNHNCVLRVNATVQCWGAGQRGQLGNGSLVDSVIPVAPTSLGGNITAIAAGQFHTCALRYNALVRCWGDNDFGQIGDNSNTDRLTSVQVSGLGDATAVVLGAEHSCALRAGGGVACWGANDQGQLGDGTLDAHRVPGAVGGLSGVHALTAGADTTCAFGLRGELTAPRLMCWGSGDGGKLGVPNLADATAPRDILFWPSGVFGVFTPLSPFPISDALQVAVGDIHACALRSGGVPACWGNNSLGQIGVGSVSGFEPAREVPSFRFNLLPTAVVSNGRHIARVTVVAACTEGALAELDVTLEQGAVTARGHAVGRCSGALESYEVIIHTRANQVLGAGPAQAVARASVRDRGEILESPEWTRRITLTE